jgi:hypothetical protein
MLGFVASAIICAGALGKLNHWGADGFINPTKFDSSLGFYFLENNGTWTWDEQFPHPGQVRSCRPSFTLCSDQDALVNQLWLEKPQVVMYERIASIAVFVNIGLSALAWMAGLCSCCDATGSRSERDNKRMAQILLQDMVRDGEIVHSKNVDQHPLLNPHGEASPAHESEPSGLAWRVSQSDHDEIDLGRRIGDGTQASGWPLAR